LVPLGISEDATSVFLELSNCPQSTPADVEVRFGNIRLDLLSVSSTQESTTLIVAIPPRACTEDCSESVLITVTDRFKKPRTASFAFTSIVPVSSAKSAFPEEGVATEKVCRVLFLIGPLYRISDSFVFGSYF
jgi:hypothetical protein